MTSPTKDEQQPELTLEKAAITVATCLERGGFSMPPSREEREHMSSLLRNALAHHAKQAQPKGGVEHLISSKALIAAEDAYDEIAKEHFDLVRRLASRLRSGEGV